MTTDENIAQPALDDVFARINPRSGTPRDLAAKNRGGATDTTYLVWKVIEANPGITAGSLFFQIEEKIPQGWALRRAPKRLQIHGIDADDVRRARRYALSTVLANMTHSGHIRKEGHRASGPGTGRGASGYCYFAVKEPKYLGNPDTIDMPGSTRAADHLRVAHALSVVEKYLKRSAGKDSKGMRFRPRGPEWEAIAELARAWRARER